MTEYQRQILHLKILRRHAKRLGQQNMAFCVRCMRHLVNTRAALPQEDAERLTEMIVDLIGPTNEEYSPAR